jgi:hypothetical protein
MQQKQQKAISFFNRQRLTKIASYFFGGIGAIAVLGWLGSKYQGIKVDWSFLLPLGGLIGGSIPIVTGMVGWVEKENVELRDSLKADLKELRELNTAVSSELKVKLNELEVATQAQAEELKRSAQDRAELRKIVLKVEARVESIRDNQVTSNLGQINSQLEEVIQRLTRREQ